jgi:oxygen-independent coproporphyrinogen-3 oxidase
MVDHFCKPGFENMYNHFNWKQFTNNLGVGPGSYSYFDGRRLGTGTKLEEYITTVESGDLLITSVTDKLSPRVERERYIVFALLYYNIEFAIYEDKFGTAFLDDFAEEVGRLVRKGLVEVAADRIVLTKLGVIWHTNVILEFFNQAFWGDEASLSQPNWSLNGVMVELGARPRSYWLGDKDVLSYPPITAPPTAGEREASR